MDIYLKTTFTGTAIVLTILVVVTPKVSYSLYICTYFLIIILANLKLNSFLQLNNFSKNYYVLHQIDNYKIQEVGRKTTSLLVMVTLPSQHTRNCHYYTEITDTT